MSPFTKQPDRNMAMELVRVTEAAAISAARYMGVGNKEIGDQAAVDAMRAVLETVDMDGTVIIGEGEKDEAPMLYNGEKVGNGDGPKMDVAVDPVEGTRLLANGTPNSIAVIAASASGSMWVPEDSLYMNKIVVEERAKDVIDITDTPTNNLKRIAKALDRDVHELTVFVLDKERHRKLIEEIREVGARITLHTDGDVMGALMAAIPGTGVDVLMGTGGTPEGVIAAAAVKALRGGMQGMRDPQLEDEIRVIKEKGIDVNKVLHIDDLIRAEDAFFAATGITEGSFLKGVQFDKINKGVTTHSIVIRAISGSIRFIEGSHALKRKLEFGEKGTRDAVKMASM